MGYEERKNIIVDPWGNIGQEASAMMKARREDFEKRGLPVPEPKGVLNFRQIRKKTFLTPRRNLRSAPDRYSSPERGARSWFPFPPGETGDCGAKFQSL